MNLSNSTKYSDLWGFSTALPPYTLYPRPPIFLSISDFHLSLLLPILAYWSLSAIYHVISTYNLFSRYRIHTSAELKTRNCATAYEVLRSVILQQFLQTLWGLFIGHVVIGTQEMAGREEYDHAYWLLVVGGLKNHITSAVTVLAAVMGIDMRRWKWSNSILVSSWQYIHISLMLIKCRASKLLLGRALSLALYTGFLSL